MKKAQEEVAEFWGVTPTSVMLIEEMGELTQAVVKYLRIIHKGKLVPTKNSKKAITDNIAEEIADVRICLDELEYLLNLEEDVEEWRKKKREREDCRARSEKRKRRNKTKLVRK